MNGHPAYGPLSPEVFAEAIKAPAGGAQKIIRKYDPLWGMGIGKGEQKEFVCEVTRSMRSVETATVRVSARSQEEAEKILDNMDWDDFRWREDCCPDQEDSNIESIKEAK